MKKLKLLIILFFTIFISCNAIKTAVYDQYSYQQTTSIKVEASKMIDKSTEQYSKNAVEVQKLLLDMEKMMEYEKNKPNNEITFAMWQLLTNKEKNSVAGFFKRWEEKGSFSPIFLEESKKQIMEGFDLLIQYEIKKDQQSKDNLLTLINK
jgi:hypothetical protein